MMGRDVVGGCGNNIGKKELMELSMHRYSHDCMLIPLLLDFFILRSIYLLEASSISSEDDSTARQSITQACFTRSCANSV
jgi:hypothetical protein